jgi:type II secretory pathway pseudopilin PulG
MRPRAAFTLVELLLALTITAVLVVLLANVVSATLGAWQQGRTRLDTFANARQLIGRLTDEMKSAIASTSGIQFVENASELGGTAPVPRTSENIFFVAPYPNTGSGDLCVLAYRHNATGNALERRFKDSSSAWNVAAADRYKVGSYPDTTPTEWRRIAQGVTEFEVRSFSQEDLDGSLDPADTWNSSSANAVMAGKTPRRVVLRIKIVDDRTLARISTLPVDAIQRAAREFYADFNLPSRQP